ncbi:MAG: LytR C-terminal domain-containing protein [Acidimicrobiales bacterium]
MAVFASVLVGAGLLGAVLAYVGVETLRDSSTGRRVTSAEPDEPGYEALLEPTPTMLVMHEREGLLQSAVVLSLGAGGQGGSVLLLPPSVEVGDDDGARLSAVFAYERSEEALRAAAEIVSGVGVQEMVVLDDARWAELVAPVAPLSVENPDEVGEFPAGAVSLGAEDVAAWLTATDESETELGVLYRHELFWQAWVEAIAAAGRSDAVPGELDSGLGRFVRGLSGGPLRVATLPVTEGADLLGNVLYHVDRDVLDGLITDLVPFPIGTATSPRTRVRLLDGTGDQAHVGDLAPAVAAAGSSVVVVGNAEAFDYDTTEIRYHQPAQRAAAERLQRALGAGEVVEDVRPIDAFDVTIVLGTDT